MEFQLVLIWFVVSHTCAGQSSSSNNGCTSIYVGVLIALVWHTLVVQAAARPLTQCLEIEFGEVYCLSWLG